MSEVPFDPQDRRRKRDTVPLPRADIHPVAVEHGASLSEARAFKAQEPPVRAVLGDRPVSEGAPVDNGVPSPVRLPEYMRVNTFFVRDPSGGVLEVSDPREFTQEMRQALNSTKFTFHCNRDYSVNHIESDKARFFALFVAGGARKDVILFVDRLQKMGWVMYRGASDSPFVIDRDMKVRVDYRYETADPLLDQELVGAHRYLPEFRGSDIGILPTDLTEDNYFARIADGLFSFPYRLIGWAVYSFKAGSLDFLDPAEAHAGNMGFCIWDKRPYKDFISSFPIIRFKWYRVGNGLQKVLPFKRILLPGICWVTFEDIEKSAR
ncbi:MAG: hypothetical protein ABIE03_06720 [Patescibacteria group bacterium]|nr:hypothetical protein [Patescibacteria group bacterium]